MSIKIFTCIWNWVYLKIVRRSEVLEQYYCNGILYFGDEETDDQLLTSYDQSICSCLRKK
jgi:hypothetical protein